MCIVPVIAASVLNSNESFFLDEYPDSPALPERSMAQTGEEKVYLPSPPLFSHNGGFFYSGFDLDLHTDVDGAEIIYTLDGSDPLPNGFYYSKPIPIKDETSRPNGISTIQTSPPDDIPIIGFSWKPPDGPVFKGTVVRARAVLFSKQKKASDREQYADKDREIVAYSDVVTHSYFVDETKGGERYPFPVISIVTDSLHLFDHETGIYVPGKIHEEDEDRDHLAGNYSERGEEWERPASFEFFDEQGKRIHHQNIGIRIHGGASRALSQKSLRLYARSEYGESRFNLKIFPDQPYNSYNRLILRNSGQDFFVRSTMFHDAFIQRLIKDLDMDTQAYRPAIVFINGEYWGIQNIRERYDRHYLERVYRVDPDDIDLLSDDAEVKEGDDEHYRKMLNYMKNNDLSKNKHYEQIKSMIDIDNFLDYSIAQVFIRNKDWPGNNNDYWRKRVNQMDLSKKTVGSASEEWIPAGHDGRWRWLFVDSDAAFGQMNAWRVASYNMLIHITNETYDEWPNPLWSTFLYRKLFQNEEFRNQFIVRSADYLNTLFIPDHVISLIDDFEEKLSPVIEEHIRRWGQIDSKDQWYDHIEWLRSFARKRPDYLYKHLEAHFNLSGTFRLEADVSALHQGRVQVNQIVIDEDTPVPDSRAYPYPWRGTYFQDIPIQIVALPYAGYRFSHWEGVSNASGRTSDTLWITSSKDISLKAVFTKDTGHVSYTIEPHPLAFSDYHFSFWSPDEEAGTYPPHMRFQYMKEPDPSLSSPVAGYTYGLYNLSSRTRVNGLYDKGIAFINTSNLTGNPGYPGRRLGAAVVALDTRNKKNIRVSWTGGTVRPNSRVYHLRLQYRLDGNDGYRDVRDENGQPVEYIWNEKEGHSQHFNRIHLPESVENKPYVELRWRYYYSGLRLLEESGARAKLRLSDIHITGDPILEHDGRKIEKAELMPNYPNPFNSTTIIPIKLPSESKVSLTLFDLSGRKVKRIRENIRFSAGYHTVAVDMAGLSSGVYIYRVEASEGVWHGRMTLIR